MVDQRDQHGGGKIKSDKKYVHRYREFWQSLWDGAVNRYTHTLLLSPTAQTQMCIVVFFLYIFEHHNRFIIFLLFLLPPYPIKHNISPHRYRHSSSCNIDITHTHTRATQPTGVILGLRIPRSFNNKNRVRTIYAPQLHKIDV